MQGIQDLTIGGCRYYLDSMENEMQTERGEKLYYPEVDLRFVQKAIDNIGTAYSALAILEILFTDLDMMAPEQIEKSVRRFRHHIYEHARKLERMESIRR
jgi:hypothetical protein